MFDNVQARYVLRAVVAAGLAAVGVAGTIWIDNPYVKIAAAVLGVFGGYLGVGAAIPVVEPNIGNKR